MSYSTSVPGGTRRVGSWWGAIDLTFFLLAIGLYNPKKFSWALRLMMAMVYVAYCTFAVHAFFFSPGHEWSGALHGLLAIGIPALLYATKGFSALKKGEETSDPYHPSSIEPE